MYSVNSKIRLINSTFYALKIYKTDGQYRYSSENILQLAVKIVVYRCN